MLRIDSKTTVDASARSMCTAYDTNSFVGIAILTFQSGVARFMLSRRVEMLQYCSGVVRLW